MKFSGQHPRGPDITSTGMALPGLLAHQPSDNSEISQNTWYVGFKFCIDLLEEVLLCVSDWYLEIEAANYI